MRRLIVTLVALACTPDLDDSGIGPCESTADCPLGRVCLLPDGECVDEPGNGFRGTFECEIVEEADEGSSGVGAIVGRFDGVRIALSGPVVCVEDGTGVLRVSAATAVTTGGMDYVISLSLLAEDADEGEAIDLEKALLQESPNTGKLVRLLGGDFDRVVGMTGGGEVYLAERDSRRLRGYVDVDFSPTIEGSTVGVPCPNGLADCTDGLLGTYDGGPVCYEAGSDSVCTAFCQDDTDCFGGTCLVDADGGICVAAES